MRFGPAELDRAVGCILGHNVVDLDGRRRLRKGRPLAEADVELLRELGRTEVWVARLEEGDVDEDTCARRVTEALLEPALPEHLGLELSGPRTGRVNLRATVLGVVRVDAEQVHRLNRHAGLTFATVAPHAVVEAGRTVATTKVLPYAVPAAALESACAGLDPDRPAVSLSPLLPKRASLLVSGQPSEDSKTVATFERAMGSRLRSLGSTLDQVRFVANEPRTGGGGDLARELVTAAEAVDLVLLAGETAVQDRHDIAPTAIEQAGGTVHCFGAPVDPGNLLLVGEVAGTPVIGVPGCARSPKRNIVDLVLPRVLVGERLGFEEIAAMGVGGLLEDVPERGVPRSRI